MATILALEELYDAVTARFDAEASLFGSVEHTFGWREPVRQLGPEQRIVWSPGDESGNAGADAPPKYPGRLDPGRPLGTLRELFTVYITGYDPPTALDRQRAHNERAQWKATRLLYDYWRRCVYLAAVGTFKVESTKWEVSKNERRAGACLICVCSIESMIPDLEPTGVPVDTHADVTTTELDVSDFQVVYADGVTPP
jgi:hypothetical protein